MPDPDLFRIECQHQLATYSAAIRTRVQEITAARDRDDLPRRARERLLRVIVALETQRRTIEELLRPLLGDNAPLPLPGRQPGAITAAALDLVRHYENIFRDWSWGRSENERQLEILCQMVPSNEILARVAIYGAGAGRLAVDLHRELDARATYALDINPLPLVVAHRLLQGDTILLPEFPIAPRGEEQVAVSQRLVGAPGASGLTFLFADALAPPFAPGSLDLVVTPWFIDVTGVEVGVTAAAINRVLRAGGRWLNLGPLLFRGGIAGQHSIEEVADIVRDSGFELLKEGREDAPYFCSPHSGSTRVETVYWFGARKIAEATRPPPPPTEPAWFVDPGLPVPTLPQFSQVHRSSVFAVGVLSMVDGRRSLAEIATTLAQAWRMEPDAVAKHLRAFFAGLLV